MRPLSTFTAVLLSSTILISTNVFAADDPDKLWGALANEETASVDLTGAGNQELFMPYESDDEKTSLVNSVERTFGINGGGADNGSSTNTYTGVGIKGNITVADEKATSTESAEPAKGVLTVSNVGSATVNLESTDRGQIVTSTANSYWTNGLDYDADKFKDGVIEIEPGPNGEDYLGVHALRADGDAYVYNSVLAGSVVNGAGAAVLVTGLGEFFDYNSTENGTVTLSVTRTDTNTKFEGNIFTQNVAQHGAAIDFDTIHAKSDSVQNNKFIQNVAFGHGGALDIHGTVTNMNNNVFMLNGGSVYGGAIYMHDTGSATGVGNTFNLNYADFGGAVAVDDGGTINLTGSTFSSNKTMDVFNADEGGSVTTFSGNGGAIWNNGGEVHLNSGTTGTTFTGNKAGQNGGAIYNAGGTVNMSGSAANTFTNNSAKKFGGAVYNNAGEMTFTGETSMSGNTADTGGAIYNIGTGSKVNFSGTTDISSNTASSNGGAIYNANGTTTLNSGVTLSGNEAIGNGGGVYNSSGTTQFSGAAAILNNSAAAGGAIYNAGSGTLTLNSVDSAGTKTMTVSGNTATNTGGAIHNVGRATISGRANYTGNSAKLGGAIYNIGNLSLSGTGSTYTTFSSNTATSESGNSDSGLGGAIYNATGGILNIGDGIVFKNNTAGSAGHDIYNMGTVNVTGVEDDIDSSSSTAHVTFNTSGGLENVGIFNFTDSTIQLHQGMNKVSGKKGTVNVDNSYIDLGDTNKLYASSVNIKNGSTVQTHVRNINAGTLQNGSIVADRITLTGSNTLKIFIDSGTLAEGTTKTITVLDTEKNNLSGDFTVAENRLYEVAKNGDGTYTIGKKKDDPINPDPFCCGAGCDSNECATAEGWLTGDASKFEDGTLAREISDKLTELSQDADCTDEEYRDALDAIAPDVSPLVRSHITEINRRLYSIISNRLYSSMERTGYIYRGKRYYRFPAQQSHLWVQGIYANSKYDVRKGFDGNDQGIAFGFDGHINEALRMGVGYSYTQGDYDSIGRETEIDSHTGMFYGEYNPDRSYVNWLATYTRSSFSENKNVGGIAVAADYDVDAIGAQVMVGQKMGPYVSGNWSTGVFMPEIGLRYLYTKQGSYTDTASQQVAEADASSLTGILGLQYTIGYTLTPNVSWYPEFRAAVTYDIIESDASMQVNLMNGNVYEVKEETMDRLGIELGGRVGLDINRKVELSLEYEGLFKGDYTNHTGLANMKYKF